MKGEKEETMEDGRKEGKKKEKEDMLETRKNEQEKCSNPLSYPLPGQCT
jgi:hypothetical protein